MRISSWQAFTSALVFCYRVYKHARKEDVEVGDMLAYEGRLLIIGPGDTRHPHNAPVRRGFSSFPVKKPATNWHTHSPHG